MKRTSWRLPQPTLQRWTEHFSDHGEFTALAEKAVVATPERPAFTEAFLKPWFVHEC